MRRVVIVAIVLLLIAGSSLYLITPPKAVTSPHLHDLTIPAGDPNWENACTSATLPDTSPTCMTAALYDLNLAHKAENLPTLTLPKGFNRQSQANQLHYLINNERTIRNLPTVTKPTSQLEELAHQAAVEARDPSIPQSMDGGSDWAGNFPNAIVVVFMWMYEDGYHYTNAGGGSNLDCQSSKAAGCWGHRDVILETSTSNTRYGTAFTTQLAPAQALKYADSYTLILAGPPSPFAIGNTRPLARSIAIIAVVMILASTLSWLNRRRRRRTRPNMDPLWPNPS
ncbi:hypothetical protein [Ferrimicrobium acidiphilum]|uniref:hypothetical protein n=1 Tax=Ferrimicrobium acidiphilum TaxID=121039 RepID=UPI0023F0FCAB|nr:hypothetical protein [Ferrimicrobium acidiphilum]